jgi:ribosome-associated protein
MNKKVSITTEYITLGQLLKYENIVSSGGNVKDFLNDVNIKVNNELENRRGKKLYSGSIIDIEDFGIFEIVNDGN